MTVVTEAFEALANSEKEAFGAPDHPVLIVGHPIGTVKPDEVNKRADAAFEKLVDLLVDRGIERDMGEVQVSGFGSRD